MENNLNTRKTAMTYGGYLGFAMILMALVMYALGKTYDREWYIQALGIIVLVVFVVLGIKSFKKENNGFLNLGQGLKTGIGIAMLAAVIYILYTVVFVKFIEPNFIDTIVQMQSEKMLEDPNMTDEMIENIEKTTRKYFFAFTIGGIIFMNLFIGFIVSLIASLVMQKKEQY